MEPQILNNPSHTGMKDKRKTVLAVSNMVNGKDRHQGCPVSSTHLLMLTYALRSSFKHINSHECRGKGTEKSFHFGLLYQVLQSIIVMDICMQELEVARNIVATVKKQTEMTAYSQLAFSYYQVKQHPMQM